MKQNLLLIACFFYGFAAAQQFSFNSFTVREGLSNNTVTAFVKDADGFLWIGTANGLNRFDGNSFDIYTNNPSDSNSIASNEITNLFTDSKKRLWIATVAGISCFNKAIQQFDNFTPDTLVLPKIGQSFVDINEDKQGNIWVGSWYDLLIFNPATKKFKSSGWSNFSATTRPSDGNHTRVLVQSIKRKSPEEFWILTSYGLYSVNTNTLVFNYYPCPLVKDFFGSSINYIDEDKNLWVGTYNSGMLRYNSSSGTWKNYQPTPGILKQIKWNIAYGVQPLNKDTIIYCANNSLVFFDKRKEIFLNSITNEKDNLLSLPLARYYKIFKDGNIFWLSSDNNGIAEMTRDNIPFELKKLNNNVAIFKIFHSKATGRMVMNYDNKVVYYNARDKSILPVRVGQKILTGELISFKEKNNVAYIGVGEDFYALDQLTQKATRIKLPAKLFAENPYTIRNAVIDKNEQLWLRLRTQGIVKMNTLSGEAVFMNFIQQSQNKTYGALYYSPVTNSIWAASGSEGVYVYDIEKKSTQHFLLNIPPSQKGATLTCITGDDRGNIYLTDANNGLFRFDEKNKTFNRYTVYEGLSSNNCNWLCFDSKGFLWIATVTGVSRFDTATKRFSNFSKEQGHPGWSDFITADDSGHLYQPWQNGYYQWNTKDFIKPVAHGEIYLRHCRLNDKVLPVDSTYSFSAHENNISFQFGYLSLHNKEPVNFEYSLNHGNWITMGNQNAVAFSNLSPNKYELEVRNKNSTVEPLTIRFIIYPPFYKTGWFIAGLAALIALFVYIVFKRRVSAVKKEAALKQKIAETEMMAMRAQMNPHFIFNCISSIDNFILDNDKENASNYLNKFAKLIRNILDNSKNEVIPFWKDWETLKLYLQLEQIRSNDKFTYTMQADEILLNGHYKIPPLIIQPYIENAIHHGLKPLLNKQGLLEIRAILKDGVLHYEIKDNGVGRKKAAENDFAKPQHQSYGMQLTKERIELFNEKLANAISITDLKDNEGNPEGTLIKVFLKV